MKLPFLTLHTNCMIAAAFATWSCQTKPEADARPSPAAAAQTPSGSSQKIAGQEAQLLVRGGAILLDVRSPSEFAEGHIQGATNIPVDDLHTRWQEVNATQPVVVYCRSGRRSARAAQFLSERGLSVHDLGGMAAWNE